MLNKIIKKLCILTIVVIATFGMVSCRKNKKPVDEDKVYYDNETDTLIFSTQELDRVFNPFFSTSGTDNNIVGMTQIGMLGNDKDGNPTFGDNEAVVTKDLEIVTQGIEDVNQTTTYYFVLKNNVKYSNGSLLTIKDVLFNLYVYLDPVYTGSSTIYSTDIVGLKEYRTQEEDPREQDNFKLQFQIIADSRIEALIDASNEIFEDHKNEDLDVESFLTYLEEYPSMDSIYTNVVKDYEKASELFKDELAADYNSSIDSYEDIVFTDQSGKLYKNLFTTDVEAFLYNEGYITWNRKEGRLYSSLVTHPEDLKTWNEKKAIDTIIADKLPFSIEEIVLYWNTSVNLYDYIVNEAIEQYYQNGSALKFKNISGIQFANRLQPVSVNGKTYNIPEYNQDGTIMNDSYEVLSITINDVDPKAIWNFAFSVAPMYYYSDEEHIKEFDFESNFGVEYGSQTFMTKVVGDTNKNSVPIGAGPYAASKSSGGIENIEGGEFYHLGVVYFERNPHFLMGPAKIKKVRYSVIAANQMLTVLYEGNKVDFVQPNAKPETISELDQKSSDGIGYKSIQTAGYGYIGINAGKVPDLAVRQAIMHSINTQECVDYYKTTAEAIYRPMSKSSWAYPKNATPYYPYIGSPIPDNLTVVNPDYANYVRSLNKTSGQRLTEQEQIDFIRMLVEGAGYTVNGSGVYQKGNNILEYLFTIAGEETDHPAWQALYHASEILNKVNFRITVKPDRNALKSLATGSLTVWAAAWGSTIDPDMYQVYHKDSNATSVLNWGYKQIIQNVGGKYDVELALVEELSELIEQGRKTNDQDERTQIYSRALDIVMQLAVELPTYQRDDLFAYNVNRIDVSSLTPDSELSPYKGLTSELYNVSFNVEK